MISQYWVNQISLPEVYLAGDEIVVRGEILLHVGSNI